MNYRLQQFLSAENITQSQLADEIGVARASVSHILAGRNKPGFDFISGMADHYPELNIEWLITGRGRMYKSAAPLAAKQEKAADNTEEGSLFPDSPSPLPAQEPANEEPKILINKSSEESPKVQVEVKNKKIAKVFVFYDDGTYSEIV